MSSKKDKEYLIAIKTEYILLERKYTKTREELKRWEERINLAKEKGKTNLIIEAEEQAEIGRNDIKYFTDQLVTLKSEVEKTIRTIHESPEQLSINPNKLLADMNKLIGEGSTMELEKNINGIKADNDLERLKREMKIED